MKNRNIVKKLVVSLLFFLFVHGVIHAQGIVFVHNLDEAMAIAKVENKPIFVDFYTSWCGPCKVLTNEVFPLERVGEFFNSNFVNCKIQCDDNGVGVEIGKQYKVAAYPTLMFLNTNGEFIHSAAGSRSPEGLIELAKEALNPEKNLYSVIKKWETGDKIAESATVYFNALKKAYQTEKASDDFIKYFNNLTQGDKISKSTFVLIKLISPSPGTDVFNYMEENLKSFFLHNNPIEVERFIVNSYNGYFYSFIRSDSKEDYQLALEKFKTKKYSFQDEVEGYAYVNETLLGNPVDKKEYQKRGTLFLRQHGKNNDSYAVSLASMLGNLTGGYDQGAEGIRWMEDLLNRNNDPRYLSTYFYILWRNHHWDDAIKVGERIRVNNTQNNIDNASIDKQIEDCIIHKEKNAQKDAEAKTMLNKN